MASYIPGGAAPSVMDDTEGTINNRRKIDWGSLAPILGGISPLAGAGARVAGWISGNNEKAANPTLGTQNYAPNVYTSNPWTTDYTSPAQTYSGKYDFSGTEGTTGEATGMTTTGGKKGLLGVSRQDIGNWIAQFMPEFGASIANYTGPGPQPPMPTWTSPHAPQNRPTRPDASGAPGVTLDSSGRMAGATEPSYEYGTRTYDRTGSGESWGVSSGGSGMASGTAGSSTPKVSADSAWNTVINDLLNSYNAPTDDPYKAQVQQWFGNVMAPGYKAISDTDMSTMYQQGKDQLEGDVFQSWEDNYSGSMANRNLTRSGVGNLEMGKLLGKEGGALSDLYSNIWQYGQDATRNDISSALSSYPAFQSLSMQQQNAVYDKMVQLASILANERAGIRSDKQANAAGTGQAIGTLVPALLPIVLSFLGL